MSAVESAPMLRATEVEQALLGCVLFDAEAALLRVSDRGLMPAHLAEHRHRLVLSAAMDLHAQRHPVDVVSVFEALRLRGQDEDVGGLQYLHELSDCVPSAANASRYAELILDRATRRALVTAAEQAIEIAQGPGDTAELADRIQTLFAAVQVGRVDTAPRLLSDIMKDRAERYTALEEGTAEPGVSTGLDVLDKALGGGVRPGMLVNIGARPSVGKTALMLQIAQNVASQGQPVLLFSMEMRGEDLADRAVASLGRVSMGRLATGRFDDGDWARVVDAMESAKRMPLHIDDRPALSLPAIRSAAMRLRQQAGGLALVAVDYLQLAASTGTFNTRHHAVEQISRGMKALAKELGCAVLLLSQLTRDSEKGEPELSHLKESGAIEEDADVVLLLHATGRPAPEGGDLLLVKVAKNRQGRRGRFGLAFDGQTQRLIVSRGDVAARGAVA